MSFLKKLFGKTDQEKEVANDQASYPVRNLEKEGYINLGRSIFPLVRNKNESKFTMQMPPGSELCVKPIAGDLLVAYVADTGKDLEYFNYNLVAKYGQSFEELEKAGLRNLFDKTEGNLKLQTFDTKGEKNPDGAPFFRIILDGTYDASLLVGQNFLEKMKEVVKDEVIAFAAPRRDVLLLSPVSNKLTLAQMARTAGSLFINATNENNNTALSNQILIRKNGQWTAIENSDDFYLKISDF
jgi:uncharacterized protein YtpQ (UPF0354 family)